MSYLEEKIVEKKVYDLTSETVPKDESSFFGRTIKWLRAPDEINAIRGARKALAIFLAIALSFTMIGIIPVVLGLIAWSKQNKLMQKRHTLIALEKFPSTENVQNGPKNSKNIPAKNLQTGVGKQSDTSKAGNVDLNLYTVSSFNFSTVTEKEVLKKQEQIEVVNAKYGAVSLEDLKNNDLLPTNKIVIDNVNYYCSKIFKLDSHLVSIALIEIDNKVYPRLLYHSNSQGTWRVMPFATKRVAGTFMGFAVAGKMNDGDKQIIHYGKGNCETDTQLPIKVTCALNGLESSEASHKSYRAERIVETVGPRGDPKFLDQIAFHQSMYLGEGAPNRFYKNGMIIPNPPNPKDIHMPLDQNLHPNFSKPVTEFKLTIPEYGEVTAKIFSSKDKSLLYMFYEAKDGRVFLSSVESIKDNRINSYGVREKVIDIENMDAPLLEYCVQIPQDFEPTNCFENPYESKKVGGMYIQEDSSKYVSNWNFVRELEIIKMYYKEQNRVVPEKV